MVGFLQELLCGEFLTFAPAIYFVRCSQVAMQEPLPVTAGAAQVHCRVTSNLEQTVVGQRQGMSDAIHEAAVTNWAVIESQHLVFCEVMFKEADWGDGFPRKACSAWPILWNGKCNSRARSKSSLISKSRSFKPT